MTQSIRPDADLDSGGWATGPLWSKLDEASAGGDVVTNTIAGPPVPPVYDKTSDNGNTLLQNWPDTSVGSDTQKIQLAVVTGPPNVGSRAVYVQTTTPSISRRDLFHWTGIQHVGTPPNYTGSPFRTGTDWWFSVEMFLPSVDVIANGINMGHWIPDQSSANWHWQLHQDNIIQNGTPPYTQAPASIAIEYNGGTPRWWFRLIGGNMDFAAGGTDVNFCSDAGNTWCSYQQSPASIVQNTWHRFVLHCNMDDDPTVGYWQIWMNSVLAVDQTAVNVVPGWIKKRINTVGQTVIVTTESKMSTNYYRVNTPDSLGNNPASGSQYMGIDNYHGANAFTSCVLHREYKAGHSLASVGGL